MVGALEHEWWFGIPTWKANNNSNVNNKDNNNNLVGGLEHEWIMTFHSVGNVIIPTNSIMFQRGGWTTNQGVSRVCFLWMITEG